MALGTLTLSQTIYVTVIPFTGTSATGTALPSIHLIGSYQDFAASKTVHYTATQFVKFSDAPPGSLVPKTVGGGGFNGVQMVGSGAASQLLMACNLRLPDADFITNLACEMKVSNGLAVAAMSIYRGVNLIATVTAANTGAYALYNAGMGETTTGNTYMLLSLLNVNNPPAVDADALFADVYVTYSMFTHKNSI